MNKILLLSGPNKKNGYDEKIKELIKAKLSGNKKIVCISASPANYEKNDRQVYGGGDSLGIIGMLKQCDVEVEDVYIIDDRNIKNIDTKLFIDADIMYFMGGDPLLQNGFVVNNNLLEHLKKSKAFIIGVSAGSMNLAKNTFIPKYELNEKARFIEGFGLCDISIVPHFDISDNEQLTETKANGKLHKLIGLPNDSAVFIDGDDVEYINDYYVYSND